MICRMCGNGPCVGSADGGETCAWSVLDTPKKSYAPDPKPTKAPKKGAKK